MRFNVEGRVPFKGSIRPIIHQMIGGIRSSMGYTGCATLEKMRTNASNDASGANTTRTDADFDAVCTCFD
jgi:IMP dehydrogenase/GMP reductase